MKNSQINSNRVKVAIQKSGRLSQASLDLLKACGLEFEAQGRKLLTPTKNGLFDLLFLRDDDIPNFLNMGKSDLGIVGDNVVYEGFRDQINENLFPLLTMPFGECRLSLAFPRNEVPKKISELNGKVIATSYPKILRQELGIRGVEVDIIELKGGVEIAPVLEICDGIFDIVSTGSTLKAHGLVESFTLFESKVRLYGTKEMKEDSDLCELLQKRMSSSLLARNSKYLMLNAPASKVDQIVDLLPGMESPSIIQLSTDATKVAVHGVIEKKVMWETIEQLKEIGASSILVMPIEKVMV